MREEVCVVFSNFQIFIWWGEVVKFLDGMCEKAGNINIFIYK